MAATISSHDFTSYGYDGPIFETGWAAMAQLFGGANTYSVGGESSSFRVTVGGTGDRAVTVHSEDQEAWAKGVYVRGDVDVNVNFAAPLSGTRYDLIVLRRNADTNTSSIVVIEGSATEELPSREIWAPDHQIDDQPIALVPVTNGSTVAGTPRDLRTWHSDGITVARHILVKSFMTRVGTRLRIGGVEWQREMNGSGTAVWVQAIALAPLNGLGAMSGPSGTAPAGTPLFFQGANDVFESNSSGYVRVTFPVAFPNGLISCNVFNGDDAALPGLIFAASGNTGLHSGSAYGSRADFVYRVRDAAGAVMGNRLHRVFWSAWGY